MIFFKIIAIIFVTIKNKNISNKIISFKFILKKTYVHVINANFNFVNVRNNENISLIMLSKRKLDVIIKCENFEIYFVIEKNQFFVFILKKNLTKHSFFHKLNSQSTRMQTTSIDKFLKIKINNDIILYDN